MILNKNKSEFNFKKIDSPFHFGRQKAHSSYQIRARRQKPTLRIKLWRGGNSLFSPRPLTSEQHSLQWSKECTLIRLGLKRLVCREALRIAREEGLRAFWKGNLFTIAHRLPYSFISFFAFECYKNVAVIGYLKAESRGEDISTDLCIRLLGGGYAGVTTASTTYPLDLVQTWLTAQMDLLQRDIQFLAYHLQEEGFLGPYKEFGPTLLGVGPNLAISFQYMILLDLIGSFIGLKT